MNNVDTLHISYYLDGTIIKDGDELNGTYGHTQEDLQRVFREALADEEWEKIKGRKNGYGLILRITADSVGNTTELTMLFHTDDPVISKFPPDRFYQLGMKFKEIQN